MGVESLDGEALVVVVVRIGTAGIGIGTIFQLKPDTQQRRRSIKQYPLRLSMAAQLVSMRS